AEAPARPPHVGPADTAPPSRSSPAAPTVVAVAAPASEPARQPRRAAVPPLSRVAAVAPSGARRDPGPPPAAPAPARLSVISSPWSYVTVDDSPTGRRTPLVNLEVPVGVRRVCLETSDGRRHCTAIRAEPGRAARVTHTFQE
ncbi:MAG: hypothetical protein QME96_08225, partial [Myxococcota bacterium]|nr:hypothetical protein [Myxococcota bacterium]